MRACLLVCDPIYVELLFTILVLSCRWSLFVRESGEPGGGDVLLKVAVGSWDVVVIMAVEGKINAGGARSWDM